MPTAIPSRATRSCAPRYARVLVALAAVLVLPLVPVSSNAAASGASQSMPSTTPSSSNAFYVPPKPLPHGHPGALVRSARLNGVPDGARGWRILYHSRDRNGHDVAVSGMVFAPSARAPKGGRPVVTWAHPTTGLADACAPSRSANPYSDLPGLSPFLRAGYVVTATDYEGLGTPGTEPYLIGIPEAHNVLDAVRAAHALKPAAAGTRFAIWGHSQGGQAALFAGQLASSYAPDLHLVGVAAAAPAGELAELLAKEAAGVTGAALAGYAFATWPNIYPDAHVAQVLTPAAVAALPEYKTTCVSKIVGVALPLAGHFFATSPSQVQPWPGLLARNTPGASRTPAPLFIAQGTADTVVLPVTTQQLTRRLCSLHDRARLELYDGVSHELIAFSAAPDVASWIADRFGSKNPAPTSC